MLTAILTVVGYLVGSMPWGYWLVRIFRGEDIRTQGSGNIGATNVWRVHGRRLGIPAVLLDTLKGFVPALLATQLVGHGSGVLAGAAAMLGHYRPLFLGFRKGGKMVATAGGAFLGVAPLAGLVAAAVPPSVYSKRDSRRVTSSGSSSWCRSRRTTSVARERCSSARRSVSTPSGSSSSSSRR
jgi:glycerol-3-phosphate acyltransferase PlsY